jgi:hypothetical protein
VIRVSEADGRVRFAVRVQPRASRTEVAGVHGDALKVRLQAPPVDGAANAALVIFLAETFAVSRSDVRILAGDNARSKIVEIAGVAADAVRNVAASSGR